MILENLDKNNLHHAYLIEGNRENIVPEILKFCESLKIKTQGNPDFCQISVDNFKIDDAFSLRAMSSEKGLSSGFSGKKIFIICANNFTLDAENVLLKMFEEPTENTHFFLVVPDINSLIKTLVSRFYVIRSESNFQKEIVEAERFIEMSLKSRLDFIKELLTEVEDEEVVVLNSNRSKSLEFLNALEAILSKTHFDTKTDIKFFEHFFKVREFLRMSGSSTKTLMESVALVVPNL